MDVLGALVARDRRSGRPAVHVAATDRSISYHDFCTTAYKAGNVLRYLGVREGAVVVVGGPVGPQPLWALYGAAQLGAVARFVDVADVGDDREATTDARVLLLPVDREETVEPSPGTKLATYGGAPTRPTTLHWEQELWSENPAVHPTTVEPSDALLSAGRTYTHEQVLDGARAVAGRFDLDDDCRVAVRGPLSEPGVVVAGLVAPLLVGGSVVVPDGEASGDLAVVGSEVDAAPEPQVCRPDDVPL